MTIDHLRLAAIRIESLLDVFYEAELGNNQLRNMRSDIEAMKRDLDIMLQRAEARKWNDFNNRLAALTKNRTIVETC